MATATEKRATVTPFLRLQNYLIDNGWRELWSVQPNPPVGIDISAWTKNGNLILLQRLRNEGAELYYPSTSVLSQDTERELAAFGGRPASQASNPLTLAFLSITETALLRDALDIISPSSTAGRQARARLLAHAEALLP